MDMRRSTAKTVLLMVVPVACAVLAVIARVHRLDLPFERDEGEYAYIAQMMLRGEAPYTEAYTMKLPGVPSWYAAFFVVFGETVRAAHIAALVADLVSAAAVTAFCRAVVVDDRQRSVVPVVAACWLLVLSTLLSFEGLVANCEKFAITSVTAGFAILVHARRWPAVGLAAVVMGSAVLCKQQVLPILPLFGLAAVLREQPHDGLTRRDAIRRRLAEAVLVGFGLALPWLITVTIISAWGSFDAFWFQTVSYASEYVGTARQPWSHFTDAAKRYGAEPAVVFALVGVVVVAATTVATKRARLLIIAWFVASALALTIGFYFRPHYFVFAIPPLAIAAAFFSSLRYPSALVAAVVLVASIADDRDAWFLHTDDKVNSDLFLQTTFVQAVPLAQTLKRISRDDERVLIIGNEPEILFLADRRSVTPYVYFYPLLERQPFAARQQQQVIDAVAANKPDHIVVQIKTLRALQQSRGLMRNWGVPLLEDFEIVWPPNSPRKLDAAALARVHKPLYLLRRKGLAPVSLNAATAQPPAH